ncbi:MAG: dihydropteroate synthase [Dongiaceae bacterium]
MDPPAGANLLMDMAKSELPATVPETASCYLRPAGLFRPGGGESDSEFPRLFGGPQRIGAWEITIRNGATIQRAIATAPALNDWRERQRDAVKTRMALLVDRLTALRGLAVDRMDAAPVLMGIVNVTPDSFSDGGRHEDPAAALAHARQLIEAGARILDIGGESTRPGAQPVSPAQEIRRVLPVFQGLQDLRQSSPKILLSIDTRHAAVMGAALQIGVDIINDVSALTGDPESLAVVAGSNADIALMHMQGEPPTMNQAPVYADVVLDVFDYLESRIESCVAAGIRRDRLIVDPGIGFGKRSAENLAILRNLALLHGLGCRALLGASRKSFGAKTQALAPQDRLPTSLAAAMSAAAQGFHILRVHDVAETRQALEIWRRIAENSTD